MNVFDLVASISINLDGFDRGLEQAKSKAKGFISSLEGTSKNMSNAFSGVKDVFEPAVKGFQAVESVGKKAGNAIMNGLKGFTAASAAVGGFGAAAVNAGMSFDATMSEVSAISGATGKNFDSLRAKALEMGAKTKFSASEAAEAMTYMGMAGWKAGDMIGGIEGIMNLAAASGEDLASTSDIVTDALSAFGLQAKDSGRFADVLAAASTSANTNVGMMGETFKYVAPVAGALGYSAEDAAISIGLMANQGIKASQAGTSLRSILTRLSTNAGETKTQMGALSVLTQELGVEFYNTDGTTRNLNDVLVDSRAAWAGLSQEQQVSYAKIIAGQEAMSGWLALMNAVPADVEKVTTAIYDCNGAAEEMSRTMIDNLQGDLTLLGSAFESLQIAISDSLTPTLREFAQFGQKAMANLLEGFQGNGMSGFMSALSGIVTDGVKMMAGKAPEFFHVAKTFIWYAAEGILNAKDDILKAVEQIMLDLVGGLTAFPIHYGEQLRELGSGIIELVASGFSRAGDAIAMHIGDFVPLIAEAFAKYHEVLFTVGIDILGAIGRGIVENKDKIRDIASETIKNMVTALRDNADDIIDGAVALLDALVDGIIDNLPLIMEAGAEIVAKLVAGISGSIPAITVVVGAITVEVLKIVKVAGDIGRAFDNLSRLIGADGINIKDVVKSIGDAIGNLSSAAGAILSKLSGAFTALWGVIAAHPVVAVVAAIIGAIALLWNKCDAFREFWIGVWDKCKEGFGKFADWCKDGIETLKAKFAEWRDAINEKFSDIGNWFKERWNAVKESASDAANAAKKKFEEFRKSIDDKFGKIADWFKERFETARKNIESAFGNIANFFSNIKEKIISIFTDIPSRLKEIGSNMMQGLVNGVTSKVSSAVSAAKSAVNKIKSVFTGKSGFDTHSPSKWAKRVFEYVMEGGVKGLRSGTRALSSAAARAVGDVKDNLAIDPLAVDTEDGGFIEYLQSLRDEFILFLEDCQESITNFGEWLTEHITTFNEWFSEILTGISSSVTAIQTSFQEIWTGIAETWGTAPEWFAEICENIRLVFEALTLAIVELFTAAVTAIQEVFASLQEAFTAVCEGLKELWTQASTFFTETFTAAVDAVKEAWATIQEYFQEVWDAIVSIFEVAPQWFSETFTAALESLQEAFDPVIDYFTVTWENIVAVFGDAIDRFAEVGNNIITGLHDGIESGREMLYQLMEEIKQALLDIISSLVDEVQSTVDEAMNQLGESVSSAVSEMKSEVDELISKIGEALSKLEAAKEKTKELEKKAEAAEKAAEEKAKKAEEKANEAKTKAETVAETVSQTVKKVTEPLLKVATGKTPTQLLREEKAGYGKTNYSKATPSQINRQDKAKTTNKKTNPNGYVSTSVLRQTQKTLTPSQINRLDKQMAQGVGFGGGGASGTGAGRKSTENLTPSQIQRMEKAGYGNTYVTINSPKAMNEAEAARQFKKVSKQLALGY